MPAGIGVDLGAVEADRAKFGELVGLGNLQNLDEDLLKGLAEAASKGGQRVVVGMPVAGQVAEGDRVVGG